MNDLHLEEDQAVPGRFGALIAEDASPLRDLIRTVLSKL